MNTQPNTKLVTLELHEVEKLYGLLSDIEHTLDEGGTIQPDNMPDGGCADYAGDPNKVTLHQRLTWATTAMNCVMVEAWGSENVIFNITKIHASFLRDKLTLILKQCLPGGSWPGVDVWLAPGGECNSDSDDLMLLNPDENAVEALIQINDVLKKAGC